MGAACVPSKRQLSNSVYHRESQYFCSNYAMGQTIGYGSFGEVKLGYHNNTNKKFAVKVIDKAEVIKNNTYGDILREKRIMQKIKNFEKKPYSFLTKLIQCSQDRENLYFVLQYAPFGNLRQLLKNKKQLSLDKIKFFCICILLALTCLNKNQIIHGDLKPENILIDEKGYFKLADFSSAHFYGCLNTDINATKDYKAPQLHTSDPIKLNDNRSDLYSLGAILWEMAHGVNYSRYIRDRKKTYHEAQLTGDSSDGSIDNGIINPLFQNFIESLMRQQAEQRPSIEQIWDHPWLNLTQFDLSPYLNKNLQPHPFAPFEIHFSDSQLQRSIRSKLRKSSEHGRDTLLSSVLLNQKKIQNLFSSFTSSSK